MGSPVETCPGLETPATPEHLAHAVAQVLPSARLTASAFATIYAFGAESSRPASSLCTLRTHQSPGEWQHSLPACPLRLWPGRTSTSKTPLRGFTRSSCSPSPTLSQRDQPLRYLHDCSDCFRLEQHRRVGFAPTEKRRLSTAHARTRHSPDSCEGLRCRRTGHPLQTETAPEGPALFMF